MAQLNQVPTMIPAAPEAAAWRPRQWIALWGLLLTLHLGALWFLSQPLVPPAPPEPFSTAFHWAVDPWSAEQLANLPTVSDPTLFALATPHGFSSAAWLTFKPPQYASDGWTESPQWLALPPARLGAAFAQSVATNTFPPLLIADKPLPRLIGAEFIASTELSQTQSNLRVLGALARRPLLEPLPLPSRPHSDLLSNTVVQILVDDAGEVFSACVLETCGLRTVDDDALQLAAQARFAPAQRDSQTPAPAGNLAVAKLVFEWHTLAAPASGSPAPPNPPPRP